jgi:Spy/CpxP family protein refolding chaperone
MGLPAHRATWLTNRFGRIAILLLALGIVGAVAAAGQDAKPAPAKDARKKEESKPAPPKLGVAISDSRALQGYTLISPFISTDTYLIDMRGQVVRTWKTDSSPALSAFLMENGHLMRPGSIGADARIFGPGPGVGGKVQEFTWDGELVWDFRFYNARQLPHHDMTRLPNGNVLMIVWDRKTAEEVIAAGRRPQMTGDSHLLVDSLIEIKPTGKTTGEVVWEWHLWDHLVQDFDKTKANYANVAEHPELVNINYGEDDLLPKTTTTDTKDKPKPDGGAKPKPDGAAKPNGGAKPDPGAKPNAGAKPDGGAKPNPPANRVRTDPDYTHFNGVAYNADLDQIAVSVWRFSEFWIIDHSTTKSEAAGHTGGKCGKGGDLLYRWGNPRAYRAGTKTDRKLFSQHNAHWIPKGLPGAGHLLLFNNGGERPDGAYSSVDELILPTDSQGRYPLQPGTPCPPAGPVWSYSAPKKQDFYSSFISGAQRLANGNTLICSGANGTVFEVTPEKEIVWKYVNPVKMGAPSGPRSRPGVILSAVGGDMLGISPEQRKQIDDIQKDVDARLDKLLTAEQKKQAGEGPQGADVGGFGIATQPGQVMAGQEQNRLKLTDDQKRDLSALQQTIDGRFASVLTDAQKKQIKSVFSPGGGLPQNLGPTAPLTVADAGKILSPAQQDTLKLSAEQKKRLEEIQKEIDAKLETLLTEDQKRQLRAVRQNPPPVAGQARPGPAIGGTPLFRAYRYGTDFPGFVGKDLTPGKTLEASTSEKQD